MTGGRFGWFDAKDAEIARLNEIIDDWSTSFAAAHGALASHTAALAEAEREIEREKAQTKIVLDSYAEENQRLSEEIVRLGADLATARTILRQAIDAEAYHPWWATDARAFLERTA